MLCCVLIDITMENNTSVFLVNADATAIATQFQCLREVIRYIPKSNASLHLLLHAISPPNIAYCLFHLACLDLPAMAILSPS